MLIEINTDTPLDIAKNSPCVVDFWASWCQPCKLTGPILEKLSEEYPDIPVYKVDADRYPKLVELFNVSGLPTVVFFDSEGKIWKTVTGAKQKRVFEDCFYAISQ